MRRTVIRGNPIKPGGKTGLLPELAYIPERQQEDFLRGFSRLILILEHP
jgi:hypothetical protein